MNEKIRFIRKRGRIIPIVWKPKTTKSLNTKLLKNLSKAGAVGAVAAATGYGISKYRGKNGKNNTTKILLGTGAASSIAGLYLYRGAKTWNFAANMVLDINTQQRKSALSAWRGMRRIGLSKYSKVTKEDVRSKYRLYTIGTKVARKIKRRTRPFAKSSLKFATIGLGIGLSGAIGSYMASKKD